MFLRHSVYNNYVGENKKLCNPGSEKFAIASIR